MVTIKGSRVLLLKSLFVKELIVDGDPLNKRVSLKLNLQGISFILIDLYLEFIDHIIYNKKEFRIKWLLGKGPKFSYPGIYG